jgi:hypothetical protein
MLSIEYALIALSDVTHTDVVVKHAAVVVAVARSSTASLICVYCCCAQVCRKLFVAIWYTCYCDCQRATH